MKQAHKKARSLIASLLRESVVLNMSILSDVFWGHSFGRSLTNRVTLVAALLLIGLFTSACPATVDDSPKTIRLSLLSASEGHALYCEDEGLLDLHVADIKIYTALIRIGGIQITTNSEATEWTTPINADLFSKTTLLEDYFTGESLVSIDLAFPQPTADGVRQGESISVFVEGMIDETPFEYRDEAMTDIHLSTSQSIDGATNEFFVIVDLHEWFTPLDGVEVEEGEEGEAEEDGERLVVSPDGRIYLDSTHNSAQASALEAALRNSIIFATKPPESAHDDDESPESSEE